MRPFLLLALCSVLAGCAAGPNRYLLIEQSLRAGNAAQADAVVRNAEDDYGSKSRVLYGMDRGMTLQLTGQYDASNEVLAGAEDEVERLFTRKIRNEALAFLLNDNELPFEGDSYEQVMINVVKAINYGSQQKWQEALVEARRIDHRLNVIADRASGKETYRDDGFARYLTGILYEVGGDPNNALVAYRRAYEVYRAGTSGGRLGLPSPLRADLLRLSEGVGLTSEFEEYRRAFPETTWQPFKAQSQLAQVVLISYNGRAPARIDQFLDVPLGLDAARLVLLSRGYGRGGQQANRAADSILYGLNGKVVRIALPRLIPQRSFVSSSQVSLVGPQGAFAGRTEPMHDITGLAEKSLSERITGITVRASARAAVKYGLAEAAEQGVRSATRRRDRGRERDRDDLEWVAFVAGALLKAAAVATEESDKRAWQTLPDHIQIARLWVPAGEYDLRTQPIGGSQGPLGAAPVRHLTLREGETRFVIDRVVQ